MMGMQKTRTISITSGKGGVGKTTLVVNLALRLAQAGKKVLILDGDLGMANVDIFFGYRPDGSILDILYGHKSINDVTVEVAKDVSLIPGGSGLIEFNNLNHFERRAMLEAISSIPQRYDYLLVDTAPGIAENVLFLNAAVQTVNVVLTPDPSSFADSYALIKVLRQQYRIKKFAITVNMAKNAEEGRQLFRRFEDVVQRFLDVSLEYWGCVPLDPVLRMANQMQRLVVRQDPQCESAKSIRDIAAQIERTNGKIDTRGGLQVFWQQAVGTA